MTSASFATFAAMLGAQFGETPDLGAGMLTVQFGDVPFTVRHDPQTWGADHVAIACDFGDIPEARRCAILEHVLMANMEMHGLWSPVFAIDPPSGHLVSIVALPLELLDAEMTMQTFARYTVVVDRWRTTHFLEGGST